MAVANNYLAWIRNKAFSNISASGGEFESIGHSDGYYFQYLPNLFLANNMK